MSIFVFGEILWDVYPEKKVLGGAPFNFAAHLSRLGNEAFLLTAIGDDELGAETAKAIDGVNLPRDFVSVIDRQQGFVRLQFQMRAYLTTTCAPSEPMTTYP